jgi:hypothetical protein
MSDHPSRLAAQAAAVRSHKQRVVVSSRTYSTRRPFRARVLVDGEYYDVGKRELAHLEAGITPTDLDLQPVEEE